MGVDLKFPRWRGGENVNCSVKRKSRLPPGLFSLLVSILLFTLQQFILLYLLISITNSWLVLLFLCWDVPLLLAMCMSMRPSSLAQSSAVSSRCAVQWLAYILTLDVKIGLAALYPVEGSLKPSKLYFFNDDIYTVDVGVAETRGNTAVGGHDFFVTYLSICLLPVLYLAFTSRVRATMDRKDRVSIEGALLADLVLSLSLDFIDIALMLNSSFSGYRLTRLIGGDDLEKWVCFGSVILSLAAVMTLGFAFPTRSEEGTHGQANIFVSAKYDMLVGLMMVDIPFLSLRLFWAIRRAHVSWFFLKNIFTIFVRPLRLNQCRLAERERAKGSQKSIYGTDTSLANENIAKSDDIPTADISTINRGGLTSSIPGAVISRSSMGARPERALGTKVVNHSKSKPEGGYETVYLQSSEMDDKIDFDMYNSTAKNSWKEDALEIAPQLVKKKWNRSEKKTLNDLKFMRTIPTKSIGFFRSIGRTFLLIMHGGRRGLGGFLDSVNYLTYAQQIRLLLVSFLGDLQQIILATFLFLVPIIFNAPFLKDFDEFFPITPWGGLSNAEKISFVVLGAGMLLPFFGFCGLAPVIDVLFSVVVHTIRQASRLLTYRTFASMVIRWCPVHGSLERGLCTLTLTVIFLTRPLLSLVRLSGIAICSMCGKRYVSIRSDKSINNSYQWRASTQEYGGSFCYASSSNAIVFRLCRRYLAPLSMHQLIIGDSEAKSLRVVDLLSAAYFGDLMVTIVIKTWAILIKPSWYSLGIFIGEIILTFFYILISQAVRILTFRRREVLHLLEELISRRTDAFHIIDDDEDDYDDEVGKKRKGLVNEGYRTICDASEEVKCDGFISSPSEMIPTFW